MHKGPLWTSVAAAIVAAACSGKLDAPPAQDRLVDLTHPFDAQTIYWPTATAFTLEQVARGTTPAGFYYTANQFCAAEHGGTHIDAPIHFNEGGLTVDAIPLERLVGPGIVVDVTEACAADPDYRVGTQDLERWEKTNGRIPDGAIVLLHTGFGRFWPDRVRYMGTDERGPGAVPQLHFPGLHPEAAAWLAEQRHIDAVGLDTPSIDHGPSLGFESHVRLSRDNIPALENVANLEQLPPKGFTVYALPMKIGGGSGGPARIVAVLPR